MELVNTDIEYISFEFCEKECAIAFMDISKEEVEDFYKVEENVLLVDYNGLGWRGEDIHHFDESADYFNEGWKRCIESRAL